MLNIPEKFTEATSHRGRYEFGAGLMLIAGAIGWSADVISFQGGWSALLGIAGLKVVAVWTAGFLLALDGACAGWPSDALVNVEDPSC